MLASFPLDEKFKNTMQNNMWYVPSFKFLFFILSILFINIIIIINNIIIYKYYRWMGEKYDGMRFCWHSYRKFLYFSFFLHFFLSFVFCSFVFLSSFLSLLMFIHFYRVDSQEREKFLNFPTLLFLNFLLFFLMVNFGIV